MNYQCPICKKIDPWFSWTDTHGIAQCGNCGAPVKLYHYDEQNHRVNKSPECIVKAEYVPILQQFREENPGTMIPSGCSFPGGQELASSADKNHYYNWIQENGRVDSKVSDSD